MKWVEWKDCLTAGQELNSNSNEELEKIYVILGSRQVTRKGMEYATSWLIQKAVREEVDTNWDDTYKEIAGKYVPLSSTVTGAHFVHRVKAEEGEKIG